MHTPEPWRKDLLAPRNPFVSDEVNDFISKCTVIVAGRSSNGRGEAVALVGRDGAAGDGNSERIIACVNACAGMVDPVKEIAELKKAAYGRA